MAKKEKKSRKELLKGPDEILTWVQRATRFVITYRVHLGVALGVVAMVAIISSVVGYYADRAEKSAFARMNDLVDRYEAKVAANEAPEAIYDAVAGDFQSLISEYGNRNGGKLARITFANIAHAAGKYDEALHIYEAALKDFRDVPYLRNIIWNGIAHAHVAKGDLAGASDFFQRIVDAGPSLLAADARFHLGEIYQKMGNTEKSRAAFEAFLENHPDSTLADAVREKLDFLESAG